MAADIPTAPPTQIRAGDTYVWTIDDLTDYSAADSWVLTYYFVGSGGTITQAAATYLTTGFKTTLTATQTATLAPGEYSVEGKVSLAGAIYTVYSGRLTVLVNMTTATEATETRSYWRKLRDDIKVAYSVFQADPTQAYSIAGERSVTLKSTADFQRALGEAQAHVRAEENAAAGGGNQNVLMRFRNSR